MIRLLLITLMFSFSFLSVSLISQELPFSDISKVEKDYTAGNVAARMVEGLGFRYYWATEGLSSDDLKYKPSESGRSSAETIKHIYDLSLFMTKFLKLTPETTESTNLEELRSASLFNFKAASLLLKSMNSSDFQNYKMGDITSWHLINGPIADALWHTGQVVMLRRASGNPLPTGVNVLMGTQN